MYQAAHDSYSGTFNSGNKYFLIVIIIIIIIIIDSTALRGPWPSSEASAS
jgi:hypothetical protein